MKPNCVIWDLHPILTDCPGCNCNDLHRKENWYDYDTGVWHRVKWTMADFQWRFKQGKVVIEEEWGWEYIV